MAITLSTPAIPSAAYAPTTCATCGGISLWDSSGRVTPPENHTIVVQGDKLISDVCPDAPPAPCPTARLATGEDTPS